EPAAGTQKIDQLAADRIHQGIGQQERGVKMGELFIADGNILLNGLDGHRQRLTIQIADGYRRAKNQGNTPAEVGRHKPSKWDTLGFSKRSTATSSRNHGM